MQLQANRTDKRTLYWTQIYFGVLVPESADLVDLTMRYLARIGTGK